jgi:hypothetical protein
MQQHKTFAAAAVESSRWGPWSDAEAFDLSDGPGLLVSPMFWLGGAASIALWACTTWLALQWL